MANKHIAVEAEAEQEESYDAWFRRQVEQALAEADDPNTVWVSHEEVMQDWEEQRKAILANISGK